MIIKNDKCKNWYPIIENQPEDGLYLWNIDGMRDGAYWIKAVANTYVSDNEVIAGPFRIADTHVEGRTDEIVLNQISKNPKNSSLASEGRLIYAVWEDEGRIYLTKSEDSGKTWAVEEEFAIGSTPSVAIRYGEAYLSYKASNGKIIFRRTINGTWREEVEIGEGIWPKLALDKESGKLYIAWFSEEEYYGDEVAISGSGWPSNKEVTIHFGTHPTITTTFTGGSGTFSAAFIAGAQPYGTTIITAEGCIATAVYFIKPKIHITPISGQEGTIVTILGSGFCILDSVSIDFGTDYTITTAFTDTNGVFSAIFTVDNQPSGTTLITIFAMDYGLWTFSLPQQTSLTLLSLR